VNAFRTAFDNSGGEQRYQRMKLDERRIAREEEKERDEEETFR
jgi:hypothetical protein